MLTQVDAYNMLGTKLALPMEFLASGSQYVIQKIDGLGPAKADISTTSYVTMPGGKFQNARTGQRNIVFSIGFNPDYALSDDPYGDLRRATYPWFTPGNELDLHFTDTKIGEVKIEGWVESCDPDIFSKDPTLVVSVICPEPFFSALAPLTVTRDGTGDLSFTNPGTAPSGFEAILGYLYQQGAGSPWFTLTRTTPNVPGVVMSTSWWEIQVFDRINWVYLNTIKGSKAATFSTTAMTLTSHAGTNVLGYVPGWLEVAPGANTFHFDPMNTESPLSPLTIRYTPKYVGL